MKKAIIFGVNGMDGSHLADFLLGQDYKVIGVKRRSSQSNIENLKEAMCCDRFSLIEGDVTDISSLFKIFKLHSDVKEVYNMAAQSHVGSSFKMPGLTWDVTGKGCMNILETIVDLGLEKNIRFYQASSSEMFGSAFSYIDTENPEVIKESNAISKNGQEILKNPLITSFQNESTRFLPQSPYAIAKCAAHETVRLYRQAYGIHASCGILFNHEGERRGELFVTRKITKWMSELAYFMLLNGLTFNNIISTTGDSIVFNREVSDGIVDKPLTFSKLRLGNVDTFRDWGYSGDYVKAMWMMLQAEGPDDYVICTGETRSIREFINLSLKSLIKHTFLTGSVTYLDLFIEDPDFIRPSEVPYLRGSAEKAFNKLKWSPSVDLGELVDRMIKNDIKRLGL